MKIPRIKGIIDRRILINYQIDKEVLENYLPKPFKPKLVNGKGIAGIRAKETNNWNNESVFENLKCVSDFFENGSVGYSPDKNDFDGLELKVKKWKVSLLEVTNVKSSFFENESIFPKGSVKFDNALLMKDIEHEWIGLNKIKNCT